MFDLEKYQESCAKLLTLMKKGRGGIYIGGYNVLGTNVFGHQFIVDGRHYSSIKNTYVPPAAETSIIALMLHMITLGMTCVDVGAGCGFYTILAAAVAGPSGRVFSFEPIPECFELIKRNADMNSIDTVTPVNALVKDAAGKEKITYFGENYRFFFLNAEGQKQKSTESNIVTLDQYFAKETLPIDFVKINFGKDLPLVIKGMKEQINFNPDIKIIAAFDQEALKSGHHEPAQVIDAIKSLGLSFYLLPSLKKVEKEDLIEFPSLKHVLLSK